MLYLCCPRRNTSGGIWYYVWINRSTRRKSQLPLRPWSTYVLRKCPWTQTMSPRRHKGCCSVADHVLWPSQEDNWDDRSLPLLLVFLSSPVQHNWVFKMENLSSPLLASLQGHVNGWLSLAALMGVQIVSGHRDLVRHPAINQHLQGTGGGNRCMRSCLILVPASLLLCYHVQPLVRRVCCCANSKPVATNWAAVKCVNLLPNEFSKNENGENYFIQMNDKFVS